MNTTCVVGPECHTKAGYRVKRYKGKNYYLHRLVYGENKGPIPEGMCVCHTCDNRACTNPDHLFLGTKNDNMQDMIQKGRAYHPEGIPTKGRPKLSEDTILYLREHETDFSWNHCREVGKTYKVSPQTIYRILTKRTWRNM